MQGLMQYQDTQSRQGAVRKPHPKVKFTKEEDELLAQVVGRCGENWAEVSKNMPGRNPRQCKERWENYISPKSNTSQFTIEEDLLLLEKYEELGSRWVAISKFFNGRSDTSIKSRYMVLKRRGITLPLLRSQVMRYMINPMMMRAMIEPKPAVPLVQQPQVQPQFQFPIATQAFPEIEQPTQEPIRQEQPEIDDEIVSMAESFDQEMGELWSMADNDFSFAAFDI